MGKRGQISIFVILGIIIIIVIALLAYFFRSNLSSVQEGLLSESSVDVQREVDFFIQSCLDEYARKEVYTAGLHGGYGVIEELNYQGIPTTATLPVGGRRVVYFYVNGIAFLPTKGDMERTIEDALEYSLDNFCLTNFQDFSDKGWNVEGDDLEVNVDLGEKTYISLNIPRTFGRFGQSFKVDSYETIVDVNLPWYRNKAEEIIQRVGVLLLGVVPSLNEQVTNLEITQEDATIATVNEVKRLLGDYDCNDHIDNEGSGKCDHFDSKCVDGSTPGDTGCYLPDIMHELDKEGYEFIHVEALSVLDGLSRAGIHMLIRDRENGFEYLFGTGFF